MSYYQGETVSKYVYFKDKNRNLFDPDSTEAKVYDSEGTYKTTVTLTKVATGKYELNYNIPSDAITGDWYVVVKGTKGEFTETEKIWFTVEKV